MHTSHLDTVVIGAGQAGLAAGYFLARRGRDFVILEADEAPGAAWRRRWESLRLFTPARYNALPGLAFPAEPYHLPTRDEVAAYLATYAAKWGLPVRPNVRVLKVKHRPGVFEIHASSGSLTARHVVVATGAFQTPRVPGWSRGLGSSIVQLTAASYRNPRQLPEGPVLVVGAGNSGTQIALELAQDREVFLSGPDVGRLPRTLLGRDVYWWIWRSVLDAPVSSRLGRHLKAHRFGAGDPLIGIDLARVAPPTLQRVGRTIGATDGKPQLEGGRVIDVSSVVWCSGFRPDYSWIDTALFQPDGYPRHDRGIAVGAPGLCFVGLRFQQRMNSSLLGGVGADAEYIVRHLGSGNGSGGSG